jgi:cell division protein FtsB
MNPASRESLGRTIRGTCISISFWTCLLVAAACYAAVALSPKYLQHQRLSAQLAANQHALITLERQTLQLKDVVTALEKDAAFAEELARVEFDAVRPGEEVLPVDAELRLDRRVPAVNAERSMASEAASDSLQFRFRELINQAAHARDVRNVLLIAAAGLVIVAFTWLQETSPQ